MLIYPKVRVLALASLAALLLTTACARPPAPVTAPVGPAPARADAVAITRDATDLPAPVARTAPRTVRVNMETVEVTGKLADGITYTYWTFDGTVPGPMVRARVGDTVELHLKNNPGSVNVHSIDLHAVTGPGGGAVVTQIKPGEEKVFSFKALNPGVFVYHCASPHIPTHIAMGMYGLIVIEPEGGFSPVDKEFYVVQGELYTEGERGAKGHLAYDGTKLFNEAPNFVVFNGAPLALTGDRVMKAKVGEKIRIFIGNAGPNLVSSLHVIGVIFDKVYPEAASEAVSNVQTTLVPAGGATVVEFTPKVPGDYLMVDHAISRAIDKGAVAILSVEGAENKEIFSGQK